MAALGSTQFGRFEFPLSTPPFCNSNALWPFEPSQKICRPAASFRSSQIEADRNTAARAKDHERALACNDDKSDDDFPSLEERSRAALRSKLSTEASKTGSTFQRPEQPALQRAGLQVDRTRFRPGGHQGGSRDKPVILDNDNLDEVDAGLEAEGAISNVDTRRIEWDTSLHDTFATSELASAPTESIDISGRWYDVEERRYIEEPAPGLGPPERHSIPSAPAQAQPQTLPQSSKPLQDQTNQQGVSSISWSTSVEPASHSLPKPFDNSDDGWTDEDTAELEKELGLAWEKQQAESSSACTPPSPSSRSVEAPQKEIQSRERSKTTGGRLEEVRDASRHDALAHDLECELRETQAVTEGGLIGVQQQEELAAQEEELGLPAVGDDQDLVEVVDLDDPEDKEATEDLPPTQPEIDKNNEHRFRLRGVRARQLPGRQTKTTQYRVVWGEHPNRSDSWCNEDEVGMLMSWPPCKLYYSQNLAPKTGRKSFEYLVDAFDLNDRAWITEDQLKVSLSPVLVAKLRASSPYLLSQAQREVLLRDSATPIRDEYRHALRASRSSALADPALEGKPVMLKRGYQDMHTEISSDAHPSVNTDKNHNACDTSDEDPRPAKRRKPRSVPVGTPYNLGRKQDTATDLGDLTSVDQVGDPNYEWEVRKVIGHRVVGYESYYLVEWDDTWMPESELAGAKEMVDEFIANGGTRTGGRKLHLLRIKRNSCNFSTSEPN